MLHRSANTFFHLTSQFIPIRFVQSKWYLEFKVHLTLRLAFLFVLITASQLSLAQDRCGTMLFNDTESPMDQQEQKTQFENWLKQKIFEKQNVKQKRVGGVQTETVYEIPVVVHVVHRLGESEGTASNIPEGQITSQINTLNEDFRRMNADQVNTPSDFEDDAADVKVEFVLAKRDPEGLPTNGIVRVVGNQDSFTIHQASELAANSYWPAEEYLNIWVANLSGGLLGFAKFPVSNEPGMDNAPNLNRLIDGVYIDYEYFGTGYNADDFSKGRTLVHEVGHWLGLRHIWGDGDCGVDDFCDDTPLQSGSSDYSKTCDELEGKDTCGADGLDMYQNYLDYSADECMNLFTNCQGDRMRTVLENSPRRKELLGSMGGQDAIQVANDLGVRAVVSPTFGNCDLVQEPQVEVRNYGTNEITSFEIDFLIDGVVAVSETFNITLNLEESTLIELSEITFTGDENEATIKITTVNGVSDGNSENDCETITLIFPISDTVPFSESFTGTASEGVTNWQHYNSNMGTSNWEYVQIDDGIGSNEVVRLNYYGASTTAFGELDYLISPVFNVTDLATVDIKFKYAYAFHPSFQSDALTVVVSTDCGATFPEDQIIFQKIGSSLATTSQTTELFFPQSGDWLSDSINIGEFKGEQIVLAFIGSNGGGNNVYLDEIEVFSSVTNEYDIALKEVDGVSIVSCEEGFELNAQVKNLGNRVLDNFSLTYFYGNEAGEFEYKNLFLEPGKTQNFNFEIDNIVHGQHDITISIDSPNGQVDEDPTNNSYTQYFETDDLTEIVPIRQKFARTLESSGWFYVRPDAPTDYTIFEFREDNVSNYALSFQGYSLDELGTENWMVSPMLDFSSTDEASMTFDVSYANRLGKNDQLRMIASTDCGIDYSIELYNKKGSVLAVTQSESAWSPGTSDDWRRDFVDLSELAGHEDVRLAFVVTNQNGNNLYIDNVELFVSSEEPIEITESMRAYPNPATDYIEVKFNFNIKEEILLRVMSLNGEVMAEQSFPNTLNQIYRIDNIKSTNNGMYIVQAIGDYTKLSQKILIQQ